MLFNSFEFLLFFPIVTLVYFLIPHKYRWFLLLSASCFFYSFFKWEYIFILLFTIIIDYFAGIWISNSHGKERKMALAISLIANIGVLALFKYYYFIIDNANIISTRFFHIKYSPMWHFLLPIGLSFHTFQAMSYTIEVYRGKQKVERNFGIYALYVMFYPQLVAGPIERPQNILHQFYEKHQFKFDLAVSGLRLMMWGMFKKVVIADNISVYVDKVYGEQLHYFFGFPLVLATFLYSIQIYCDFSGYSDIAIGSARVMGFDLMKNFNRPYFSKTISEFWTRWHISLSTWFRDYLYIPLGGNRVSTMRKYFNLFVVFMVSGLWHGASWNFIIWGALHGIYLIFGQMTAGLQARIGKLINNKSIWDGLNTLSTYLLVVFAWIFFRAKTWQDTKYIIKKFIGPSSHSISRTFEILGYRNLAVIFFGVLILILVENINAKRSVTTWLDTQNTWVRWSVYYFFTFAVLLFGYFGEVQFIYFQF